MRRLSGEIERPVTFIVPAGRPRPDLKMQMEESVKPFRRGGGDLPADRQPAFGMLIGFPDPPPVRPAPDLPVARRTAARRAHPSGSASLRSGTAILTERTSPATAACGTACRLVPAHHPPEVLRRWATRPSEPTPGPVGGGAGPGRRSPPTSRPTTCSQEDGGPLLMLLPFNHTHGNHDVLPADDPPRAALGLGDGGATADDLATRRCPPTASPTGPGTAAGAEAAARVRRADADPAHGPALRPATRHAVEVGKRADLNVIDHAALASPRSPGSPTTRPGGVACSRRRRATPPPSSPARSPAARRRHWRPAGRLIRGQR